MKTLDMKKMKTLDMKKSPSTSTPEKAISTPRSRVVYSVKEVKEVAFGLQSPRKVSTNSSRRLDLKGSCDDDLLAVEEQLRSTLPSSDRALKGSKMKTPDKIPQKYEILVDFFNSMECSIRLLGLKRLLPTFANICSSIQHLTGRRFTYGHLAQMKYILPEAISIKKVILRDEATCCMKPELQVYLQTYMIDNGVKRKEESGYSILRKCFRQRLVDFSREHPEVDDIPEEPLPHPFGHQTEPNTPSISTPVNSSADAQQFVTMASHIPRSFQRKFCQKTVTPDAEKTSLVCFNKDAPKDDSPVPIVRSPITCTSKPDICEKPLFVSSGKEDITAMNGCKGSPQKLNNLVGTPTKLVSTPIRLMTATPEIQPPKRYCPTTADDTPVKELERRPVRTKLFSTPQKSEETTDSENVTLSISDNDDDVINILPEGLLQEIRDKERKSWKERDPADAFKAKRRKEMVAGLPKLFDMILLIFQSRNRSTITKQELIHKIMAGCFTVVDRSEVEQQLKLLQELAPDWISSKSVTTGDFLYSVNKGSSQEEIRRRLAEAK